MEQILSHGSLPKQAELNPDKGVKDFVARQPDPMRMCPDIPASKAITSSVILLLIAGVAIPAAAERNDRIATTRPATRPATRPTTRPAGRIDMRAIEALVALLKLGMPADWEVRPIRKGRVGPTYWPEGQGVHINLLPKAAARRVDAKSDGVHLWVMSPQYWAHPPRNKGNRQTIRARQIAFWRGRRVFIWGDPGESWPPGKYIGVVRGALAASSGIPGALSVVSDRPGTYVSGKWKYVLSPTRSYRPGLQGSLQYDGKGVAGARYVRTPWGEMQDIPSRRDMSGRSGWMPTVVESPVRKEFFNAGAR